MSEPRGEVLEEEPEVNEPGSGREQLLIDALVGLADTLVDDYDMIDLLDRLVSHSVDLLAADAAGILLTDPIGRCTLCRCGCGDRPSEV